MQAVDGIAAVELSDDQSSMFKSLQGVYALTISPSLQVRADVRDALREIGIMSDSVVDIEQARGMIAAFDEAISQGKGVVTYNGRMIENLHVENAKRILAVADAIAALG